jgi:nucleotide-binding universal stress UspA family protein
MAEDKSLKKAESLRKQWGDRLDELTLPCPLCRGSLLFHGVGTEQLYEFAEGEPDVVNPLDVQPMAFICDRCGYRADFDADLFNPGYLAQLQGATPERVAALSVRDYQVLVPLTGEERSDTLLDLASAVAGVHRGEVLVLHVEPDLSGGGGVVDRLLERIQSFTPAGGDPAPVRVLRRRSGAVGEAIVHTAADKRVELLLVGWRGWTAGRQAVMGSVLDTVLQEAMCDVGVVHDRGLSSIRRILLPTAGGPHARLGFHLAHEIAQAFGAELDLLYVASPRVDDVDAAGQVAFNSTVRGKSEEPGRHQIDVERRVVINPNPVQAIVEEAAGYDLLLIGASPRKWLGRVRHGDMALKIARNCNPTSIVVSARNTLLGSWLNRLLS